MQSGAAQLVSVRKRVICWIWRGERRVAADEDVHLRMILASRRRLSELWGCGEREPRSRKRGNAEGKEYRAALSGGLALSVGRQAFGVVSGDQQFAERVQVAPQDGQRHVTIETQLAVIAATF